MQLVGSLINVPKAEELPCFRLDHTIKIHEMGSSSFIHIVQINQACTETLSALTVHILSDDPILFASPLGSSGIFQPS